MLLLYLLLSFFQAVELRSYFKSLGAEITLEGSEKGIEDDLHKIIGVCDACFKDQPNANPSEIEEVFNGIVSMLALVRLTTHSFNEHVHSLIERGWSAPFNVT